MKNSLAIIIATLILNSCDLSFGDSNFYFDKTTKNIISKNPIRHLYINVENGETYHYDINLNEHAIDILNIEEPPKNYKVQKTDYKSNLHDSTEPFRISKNIKFTIRNSLSGFSGASTRLYVVDSIGNILEIQNRK